MGLSASEEKLRAISLLEYPITLGELEYYLGLTNYLRQYVYFYTALARLLQDLKTLMLKGVLASNRKSYVSRAKLPLPTPAEQAAFDSIQEALSKPDMLVHFNPNEETWVDLDVSKEFGIGVIIFHLRPGVVIQVGRWPTRA